MAKVLKGKLAESKEMLTTDGEVYVVLYLGEKTKVPVIVKDTKLLEGKDLKSGSIKVEYEEEGERKYAVSVEKADSIFVEQPKAEPKLDFSPVVKKKETQEAIKTEAKKEKQESVKTEEKDGSTKVDKKFIVEIKGKQFIKFNGVLDLAHKDGLVMLQVTEINVDNEKKCAWCVAKAEFKDGRVFDGAGSANPENCGIMVKHHYAEMAQTRAFARALKVALNLDFTAVEELSEQG